MARARLRFWLVLIVLVALSLWLTVIVWRQIERLIVILVADQATGTVH